MADLIGDKNQVDNLHDVNPLTACDYQCRIHPNAPLQLKRRLRTPYSLMSLAEAPELELLMSDFYVSLKRVSARISLRSVGFT